MDTNLKKALADLEETKSCSNCHYSELNGVRVHNSKTKEEWEGSTCYCEPKPIEIQYGRIACRHHLFKGVKGLKKPETVEWVK